MHSKPDAAELARVAQMMRVMIIQNAFYDRREGEFPPIDLMSAAILERKGLLKGAESGLHPADLVEILTNADHPKRLPGNPGPIVFIRVDGNQAAVFEPADLLADERQDIREAAAQHFAGLPEQSLSLRTRTAIQEARPAICSEEPPEWQLAAGGVYESLENDFFLHLAGFRQSYPLNYRPGVDKHLPRLLRPNLELLSSVELAVWAPSEEREKAVSLVQTWAMEAESLPDALNKFYHVLGHLPLTGLAGIEGLVRQWVARKGEVNLWADLWSWADRHPSPLPRYHICAALLAAPQLVPSDAEPSLWAEIAELACHPAESDQQPRWTEAWLLRNQLARHYENYLECLLPGLPGERLAALAWWLTERLAESFPLSAGLLRKIRETTVAAESEWSDLMNKLAHPVVGPSPLRYLTQTVRSVWSTSILCELGVARELLT